MIAAEPLTGVTKRLGARTWRLSWMPASPLRSSAASRQRSSARTAPGSRRRSRFLTGLRSVPTRGPCRSSSTEIPGRAVRCPDAARRQCPRSSPSRHAPRRRAHPARAGALPGAAAADVVQARFGLERLVRRQVGGLSGGERRRLGVALAFAGDPALVVLDEPTAGSTATPAERSGTRSGGGQTRAAPCCSRPTTWRRPTRSPTASSGSIRDGSSTRGSRPTEIKVGSGARPRVRFRADRQGSTAPRRRARRAPTRRSPLTSDGARDRGEAGDLPRRLGQGRPGHDGHDLDGRMPLRTMPPRRGWLFPRRSSSFRGLSNAAPCERASACRCSAYVLAREPMHDRALRAYPAYLVPTLIVPSVFFLFLVAPGTRVRGSDRAHGDIRRVRGDRRRVLPVRSGDRRRQSIALGALSPDAPGRPVGAACGAAPVRAALCSLAAGAVLMRRSAVAVTTTRRSPLCAGWLELSAGLLAGTVPFAFLGIALGYWAPVQGSAPDRESPLPGALLRRRAVGFGRGDAATHPVGAAVSPLLPTRALADALLAAIASAPSARSWPGVGRARRLRARLRRCVRRRRLPARRRAALHAEPRADESSINCPGADFLLLPGPDNPRSAVVHSGPARGSCGNRLHAA